ncbi:T9SS type A sorting domain-containing protein [Reichenbachiella versicolor]|uniref:T9SS type A sorting domain-containing protein n=1 Tax=Reichenbachiella versicolor TaxID=1821036 RepID=UPI0013A55327|nr:T9SS type A sorting domain-containing protein [Reichenbachiella versicolor]
MTNCYYSLIQKLKRGGIFTYFILSTSLAFAVDETVTSLNTDAEAKAKLINVFSNGGTITFQEGSWSINLNSGEAKLKKDVTIIGSNIAGTADNRGAYDSPASNIKSIVTFTGERVQITSGCNNLNISNIQINRRGFHAVNRHQPDVDISNCIFDIESAPNAFLDKQIFRCPDGLGGSIKNCTFLGFEKSIVSNRTASKSFDPFVDRKKLVVEWCNFIPSVVYQSEIAEFLTIDAGNDEFPALWDQNFTEVKNSKMKNCRTSISKGSNVKITNNIFDFDIYKKEVVHAEEFSQNIIMDGNTVNLSGTLTNRQIFNLGATQSCTNITMINNTVNQPAGSNLLGFFAIGMALDDITITGNTINNPVAGKDYIRSWGCGSTGLNIGSGQPGLGVDHQDITTKACPDEGIGPDGTYLIRWNDKEYLANDGGLVKLIESSSPDSDDNFLWEIEQDLKEASTLGNYYIIKNVGTGEYLYVYKGPNAPQQRAQLNNRFSNGGEGATNAEIRSFSTERKPGWSVFKGTNGKYVFSPGGNEHKSALRKVGDLASLFVIEKREASTSEWSFIKATKKDTPDPDDPDAPDTPDTPDDPDTPDPDEPIVSDIEEVNSKEVVVFPNPAENILSIKGLSENLVYEIHNSVGVVVLKGTAFAQIDISNLDSGVYILKLEGEKSIRFVKK